MSKHPLDNLVRAMPAQRAQMADGNTMVGHFAVFDSWTEIRSMFEGNFLERIARGAFAATFKAKRDQIRVLYDHGADPTIGNKPLGTPSVLREDRAGAYYEVPLFDTPYVNDLKPAIRSGALGASFRFKVTGEEWVTPAEATADNPQRLDERTITSVDLYEFGPVTFPAYADATAGMRSRTDEFMGHLLDDPQFLAAFIERVGARPALKILDNIKVQASDPQELVEQLRKIDKTHGGVPITVRSPLTSAQFQPEPEPEDEDPDSDDVEPEAEPDEPADGGETETKGHRQEWVARATADFAAHLARLERQNKQ